MEVPQEESSSVETMIPTKDTPVVGEDNEFPVQTEMVTDTVAFSNAVPENAHPCQANTNSIESLRAKVATFENTVNDLHKRISGLESRLQTSDTERAELREKMNKIVEVVKTQATQEFSSIRSALTEHKTKLLNCSDKVDVNECEKDIKKIESKLGEIPDHVKKVIDIADIPSNNERLYKEIGELMKLLGEVSGLVEHMKKNLGGKGLFPTFTGDQCVKMFGIGCATVLVFYGLYKHRSFIMSFLGFSFESKVSQQ